MNPKVVVDASVWVSRFMPTDINRNPSIFWLNRFTSMGGILVEPIFLQLEVAAAISRLTGQPDLSRNALADLNSTNTIQFVPLDSTLMQAAINAASDLRLRAGDTIYVAFAHQMSIPLISWDREQLARASSFIQTYTPDSYTF